MATFDELLKATGLPEPALAPLRAEYEKALSLITKNNERVAQVNAAKAQDPTKPGYDDYLDALWAAHAPGDKKLKEVEEKYQVLISESEKLLKQLREFAKTKVQPPLSEDDAKNVKQAINESGPAIQTAKAQFAGMAMMVDGYLDSLGKGIPGGLVSLLPEVETLKNIRGRKATTAAGGGTYMTRIGEFILNGRAIHRDGKTNFRYGADSVSNAFGVDKFPENKITGEELEEAYFKSLNKELRSLSSSDIPESHTFTFTKEVKSGESTTETKSVEITVKRKQADAKPAETTQPEKPTTETEKPAETPKPETEAKAETKQEVPAPAKKVAAPTPKK